MVEDLRKQKAVSLNMETRKTEQEERRLARLERENERRAARGLEALESLEGADAEETPDVLLNQAAEILADYSTLNKTAGNAVLSHLESD